MVDLFGKITFFHFTIHLYAICGILGGIVLVFWTYFLCKKIYKIPFKPVLDYFFWAIPIGIIGARLWYVFGNFSDFNSFSDVIAIWDGGQAIEGAVIACFFFGLFYFLYINHYRGNSVPLRIYADLLLPNFLILQIVGRWGNFFNQEILGDIMNSNQTWWIPLWIANHLHLPHESATIIRQPLFLYESFLNFLLWIFLMILTFRQKNITSGIIACGYLIGYGLIRAFLEPLRLDQFVMKIGNLPLSLLTSVVFASCGFGNALYLQFFLPNTNIVSSKHTKTVCQ